MNLSLLGNKNLLAFSAGIDSSALFFMLRERDIPFDIAIVNYGTRSNSDLEVAHAKKLANKYGLRCYSINAPKFDTHFEQNAREFRYSFFQNIISTYGYDTLLTAHQLNDQLEWLLMRLTKGAGVSELLGLEESSQRDGYSLVRPLLEYSKDELLSYLQINEYPYFVDESNSNEKYERNRFRKEFSDPLISKYKNGIKRSFRYLRADKVELESKFETKYSIKELLIIKLHTTESKVKACDKSLKKLGYLLSGAQRVEISHHDSLVVGGKWAIEKDDNLIYIAPYITISMPKSFKEKCRVAKIPSKIRAYCYKEKLDTEAISNSY